MNCDLYAAYPSRETWAGDLTEALMRRGFMIAGVMQAMVAAAVLPIASAVAHDRSSEIAAIDASANLRPEKIDRYQPRFGRKRPVIAVVGENAGTEITDFVIPYAVLSRSGVAEVVSVAVAPGEVRMRHHRFTLDSTLADFDQRFPQGADYIVIPQMDNEKNPALLRWIAAQSAKGGTVVSICLGAHVVANTGLLDGRRATSWWGSEATRVERHPKVRWQRNIRYVSEGKFVSSAGISASMPTSIALVEAIAGRAKATALAQELGMGKWGSDHNSDRFHKGPPLDMRRNPNPDLVGIPVKPGDDEIALALTAEAYSIHGKSRAMVVTEGGKPVRLAHGLVVLPDQPASGAAPLARTLPPLSSHQPAKTLDRSLADVAAVYGAEAARTVARVMEYPGY